MSPIPKKLIRGPPWRSRRHNIESPLRLGASFRVAPEVEEPAEAVRLTGVGSGPAFADGGLEMPGEKGGYEAHHLGRVGIVAGHPREVDGPIVFGRKAMQRRVEHDRVAGKDARVLGAEEGE